MRVRVGALVPTLRQRLLRRALSLGTLSLGVLGLGVLGLGVLGLGVLGLRVLIRPRLLRRRLPAGRLLLGTPLLRRTLLRALLLRAGLPRMRHRRLRNRALPLHIPLRRPRLAVRPVPVVILLDRPIRRVIARRPLAFRGPMLTRLDHRHRRNRSDRCGPMSGVRLLRDGGRFRPPSVVVPRFVTAVAIRQFRPVNQHLRYRPSPTDSGGVGLPRNSRAIHRSAMKTGMACTGN
jgi:hypothetical protein